MKLRDPGFEKGRGAVGSGARSQDLLGQFRGLFKKIGAKGVGSSGSATETKYFDTPRHQSKMAPALLCLIA